MPNEEARAIWLERGTEIGGSTSADQLAQTMLFAYQMLQGVILQELTITPTLREY